MECITLDLTFWIKGRGKVPFFISFAENKIVKGNRGLQFSQVGLNFDKTTLELLITALVFSKMLYCSSV